MTKDGEKKAPEQPVMAGGGYYNVHSQVQASAASLLLETLKGAARELPITEGAGPLVVADYGSAQGRNSLEPMGAAAAILRARTAERPILIVHTDQAGNDFSSLFELTESSPESYLMQADTYGVAVGRSFYEQILPRGFVNLGWSAHAVHWLSDAPRGRATSFWSLWLEGDFAWAMAEQAARDWRRFLACRARELAPGAKLLIIAFLRDQDGRIGVEGILKLMDQAIGEMVAEGALSEAEREGMVLPNYFRSEAEFRAPFGEAELTPLLVLEELQGIRQLDPFHAAAESGGLGKAVAGFVRGFAGPYFTSRLSAEHAASGARLTEVVFSKLAALVDAAGDLKTATNMALMTIRRTDVAAK
jgi:hypothetical protein